MDEMKTLNSALSDRLAVSTALGLGVRAAAEKISFAISRIRSENEKTETDTRPAQRFRRHSPRRIEAGGALAPNAIYVDRITDDDLWSAVQKRAGIATLTAPRTMGKTTLLSRLQIKAAFDRKVIWFDAALDRTEDWLYLLAKRMADELEMLPPDPAAVVGADGFSDFNIGMASKF